MTCKSSQQRQGHYADVNLCLLHWFEFLEIRSPLPTWSNEGDSLTHGDFPHKCDVFYKRVTATWLSELLSHLLFLKINQTEIILRLKRRIWGLTNAVPLQLLATNLYGMLLY